MVIAVPALVRIVATPIITHQADRRRALKATLVIGAVVGLFAMITVGTVGGAIAILAAFTVAMAALSPMLSLSDAYALAGLGARGRAYGPVRLWGSVAFIAGNVGAGFLLEVIAPGHLIWLIVSALVVVVLAAAALAPVEAGTAPAPAAPPPSPKILLRNPAFLAIVLASSMIQGSHALYYGFSTMDWRAVGLDGTSIGMLWGSASQPRSCYSRCRDGCRRRFARRPCLRSAAWARSCVGPRWRSIRPPRCCRRCSFCTRPRSARLTSA